MFKYKIILYILSSILFFTNLTKMHKNSGYEILLRIPYTNECSKYLKVCDIVVIKIWSTYSFF